MPAAEAQAAGVPIASPPALPERFGVTVLYELLELAERFGQRPDLFCHWLEREPAWLHQLLAHHRARRQIESGEEAYLDALRQGTGGAAGGAGGRGAKPRGA